MVPFDQMSAIGSISVAVDSTVESTVLITLSCLAQCAIRTRVYRVFHSVEVYTVAGYPG